MILDLPHLEDSPLGRARAAWFEVCALTSAPFVLTDLSAELERYHAELQRLGLEVLIRSLEADIRQDLAELPPPVVEPAPEPVQAEPVPEPVQAEPARAPETPVPEVQEPEVQPELQPELQEPEPEAPKPVPIKKTWEEEAAQAAEGVRQVAALIQEAAALMPRLALTEGRAAWEDGLRRACSHAGWEHAPRDLAKEVAQYLAASLRGASELLGPSTYEERKAAAIILGTLSHHYPLGQPYVHGLHLSHEPPEGKTWLEHAMFLRAQLLPSEALEDPKPKRKTATKTAAKTASSKPKKAAAAKNAAPVDQEGAQPDLDPSEEADADLPEALTDRLIPLRELTRGQKWAIVGGDPRAEKVAAWTEWFQLSELEWVKLCRTDSPRRTAALSKAAVNGSVQGVILLLGFCSHAVSASLLAAAKKRGMPVFVVPRGYGGASVLESVESTLKVGLVSADAS